MTALTCKSLPFPLCLLIFNHVQYVVRFQNQGEFCCSCCPVCQPSSAVLGLRWARWPWPEALRAMFAHGGLQGRGVRKRDLHHHAVPAVPFSLSPHPGARWPLGKRRGQRWHRKVKNMPCSLGLGLHRLWSGQGWPRGRYLCPRDLLCCVI